MKRTMTIDTGEILRRFVENLVLAGSYKTNSEVIRAGLRLLQEKQANSKLNTLRQLIDKGEQSGDAVEWNAKDFLSRMHKKFDA